jgi:SAM-dependent methyltransferase
MQSTKTPIQNHLDKPFKQRLETYRGETKADRVKENYLFLFNTIKNSDKQRGQDFSPATILDVGCATGDLLLYLNNKYPAAQLFGIDNSADLLEDARKREAVTDLIEKGQICAFIEDDALSFKLDKRPENNNHAKSDLTTLFGVMGVFDSFEEILENLLANTSKGGRIYVHGLMNKDDIDVQIRYRDNPNDTGWMRGFNIFSRTQIRKWCEKRSLDVNFYDFYMQSELPKREDFPHRAHTQDLSDGRRVSINGLCLILPETLMEIFVP